MDGRHKPVERLAIDDRSPWWGEHCSRYRFAQPYVVGKKVLDIACGTGFGCAILEEAGAKYVVGVDLDASSVMIAYQRVAPQRRGFIQGNGIALPFADARFDMVTSFETLEHIPDGTTFLSEVRRVTGKGGWLVLSTPNALITSRYPRNPFHVYEYTPAELRTLLGKFYGRVELRGQVPAPYYRIVPFLPGREKAQTRADHLRRLLWKVGNRLPFRVRDFLALTLSGRHFYPGEADYHFEKTIEDAPVLVAVCDV